MRKCQPTFGNGHGGLIDSGNPTHYTREFNSNGFTRRNLFIRPEWAWDGVRSVHSKGIPVTWFWIGSHAEYDTIVSQL